MRLLKRSNRFRYKSVYLLCWGLLSGIATAQEEEMPFFNFVGMKGDVGLQYVQDESLQGPPDGPKTDDIFTSTQEEVYLLTRSYIYHPNLLQMDLGGGLTYNQNKRQFADRTDEYDNDLYSLTARLRFLNKKPYPFSLYYDRSNPTVGASSTERFVQLQEKYGVEAALLQPLLPFSVEASISRETSQGEGLTQVVDETNDNVFLRAYRALGRDGHSQFTYNNNRRQSASGNLGLDIDKTDVRSEATSLDTHFNFGENGQHTFTNLISYFTQNELPNRREFRVIPILSLRHSERFSSFYHFSYITSTVDTIETRNRSGSAGVNFKLSDTISTTAEVNTQKTETTGLISSTDGLGGSIKYLKPFDNGSFSMGMGLNYSRTGQKGTQVQQIGETLRLEGLDQVSVSAPYVSGIQVYNETRTQIYIEDIDYRIITVGATTYIQRLSTGNIQPGETVSVDYTYQTMGDVTYSATGQNVNAALEFLRFYTLFADYSETSIKLEEGEPTLPLNSVRNTRFGARVAYPFLHEDMRIGGETSHEEQRATVNSYDRDSVESFYQAAFAPWIRLSLTARRVRQDNHESPNDVDLRQQTAALTTYPWPRASVSLQVSNLTDTGGTIPRRVKEIALVAHWQIRKLALSVDGRTVDEFQGTYERRRNQITAILKRTF